MKKVLLNNMGQTLVEVVVAMGILGIAMTAMMSLSAASRNLLYTSTDNTRAYTLAQEGIEIARHQRDIGCSFTNLAALIAGGTNDFVITSDVDSTKPNDETLIRKSASPTYVIPNFSGFARTITIKELSSSDFNGKSIVQDSNGNSYFQNDTSCGKTPIDPSDQDCRDRYYNITVTVTGPNNVGSSASTILAK